MNDSEARLRLSLIAEPGDRRIAALLTAYEPAELLRAITRDSSSVPELWRERAATIDTRVEATLKAAQAAGLRWVSPAATEWPSGLDGLAHALPVQEAAGAPLGLWVRGSAGLDLLSVVSLAIVGARDCTAYGAEIAADTAAEMAQAGISVVSGAAFGIDAAAHRGALAAGGAVIAVLACGADLDYPRANSGLLAQVAAQGLVISEQPPGQLPIRSRFLTRNRLIAALAGGTLVVEAAVRSGSLNTLRWSDSLGRPSMAVPGPVGSAQSAGCHRAIRDGKAVLVSSGRDVLAELAGPGGMPEPAAGGSSTEYDRLGCVAQRTLDALDWREALGEEQLSVRAGLALRDIVQALDQLCAAGLARNSPGGWLLARRADLA